MAKWVYFFFAEQRRNTQFNHEVWVIKHFSHFTSRGLKIIDLFIRNYHENSLIINKNCWSKLLCFIFTVWIKIIGQKTLKIHFGKKNTRKSLRSSEWIENETLVHLIGPIFQGETKWFNPGSWMSKLISREYEI